MKKKKFRPIAIFYLKFPSSVLNLEYILARFLALVTTMVTKVDHGN